MKETKITFGTKNSKNTVQEIFLWLLKDFEAIASRSSVEKSYYETTTFFTRLKIKEINELGHSITFILKSGLLIKNIKVVITLYPDLDDDNLTKMGGFEISYQQQGSGFTNKFKILQYFTELQEVICNTRTSTMPFHKYDSN